MRLEKRADQKRRPRKMRHRTVKTMSMTKNRRPQSLIWSMVKPIVRFVPRIWFIRTLGGKSRRDNLVVLLNVPHIRVKRTS